MGVRMGREAAGGGQGRSPSQSASPPAGRFQLRRPGLSRDLIARAFQGTMRRRPTAPRPPPCNLGGLLDCIEEACAHAETVSGQAILNEIGQRSFGALLLLPAIIVVSPLSGIIGLPTAMAVIIVAICGQMLLGRREFWVPRAVTGRSVPCRRVHQALRFLRPPARLVDRVLKPRLILLTQGIGTRLIALACLLLALLMPPMEMVPFTTSIVAGVISVFALALASNDGLMALLGYGLSLALAGSLAGLFLF